MSHGSSGSDLGTWSRPNGLDVFDAVVRTHPSLPHIPDDVFYDIIVPLLAKSFCRTCRRWIGQSRIFACFFKDCAVCFYCRHRAAWPG